jgi:DNA-binding Lrp family transcriptional regulator
MEESLLEFQVLDAVEDNDGSLTQRDISQKIGCSAASVNFALRLLAVKGFIKISGANPRRLRYHLTPRGVVEKSVLAYNFLKQQSFLYDEARNGLLEKLKALREEGVQSASVYGWTPLTEACLLYLISERIEVKAVYVEKPANIEYCNRIPVRPVDRFADDVDVLVLMEPLPTIVADRFAVRTIDGFPGN